ncbi:hypothetical protein [Polyangium sorediatum]|uniref:Uncharacterized protein n=1 Tax=Polyangium sorediatum TaxID=889274 RepID=A0ABT6NU42_9BACT|nr:hypothetical protein [Polyangium sorediatum]MDI1431861.1 hypothetical protein [Polyangium sorediatum]
MAGWSIGKHRLEVTVDVRAPFLTILLDEEKMHEQLIPTHLLGDYPLVVGKREVLLKRVRNLDVAQSEVWIDGVKVPPSADPIPRHKPPMDGECEVHPGGTGGYRELGALPVAKLACGVCRVGLCNTCVAVDGVRCASCFEQATTEMVREEREWRTHGPLIGVALGALVFIFGLVFEIPRMAGIGLAAIVLVGINVGIRYVKERREAKNQPSP